MQCNGSTYKAEHVVLWIYQKRYETVEECWEQLFEISGG